MYFIGDWVINVHWADFFGVYTLLPNLCRFFFHVLQMLLCYTITIKGAHFGEVLWMTWCFCRDVTGSWVDSSDIGLTLKVDLTFSSQGPFPYADIPGISTSLSPPCFLCFSCPFPLSSLGLLWKGWGSIDKSETLHSSIACLSWEHHCMGFTFVILLLFQRKKLKAAVPSNLLMTSLTSTLSEKSVIL